MNRVMYAVCVAGVLAFASAGHGGPLIPFEPQKPLLQPLVSAVTGADFKGGQRACAIAMGDGATYLGLYVYDTYGNCVAWDDEGTPATRDDLAVEWYPTTNAVFMIEVRNCGMQLNKCKIVLR